MVLLPPTEEQLSYLSKHNLSKKFQKAKELLELVKEKPALSGKQQLPVCFMYLAQSLIGLYQFTDALVYCELSKSNLVYGSWNYGETLLLEFYVHFYSNDFEKAYECIIKLTDTNDYPATLFKMNERRYLKTCCLMAMGKNIEAEQELGQIYQITKDKTGWNIGLRLLSVMLNYVNEKPENMLRSYENLQLELRRIKNLVSITERDKLIISVLKEMLSNSGSLKNVAKKCSQTLEKMKAVNGNVAWQMFGHELLPFHQWFECKLQRRSFEVNLNYSDKNKQIPVS
jgi:tetratricopeptide (TPR) repeat protein